MLLAERDRLRSYFESTPPMTILSVQDTTDIDLTTRRVAKELGSLNYPNRKGYYAHNHVLFNTQGISLGLFDQFLWNRNPDHFGLDRSRWALEDKESYRWLKQFEQLQDFFSDFPQHTIVEICDREGDFYEIFQAQSASNVHLLIRSRKDKILSDGEKLWSTLDAQKESDTYTTKIYDEKGKKHKLTFSIKFCPVTIAANARSTRDQPHKSNPVQLNAILVEQLSPLQDWQDKPIIWRLLTTMHIDSFEIAKELIQFYVLRWRIEEFH